VVRLALGLVAHSMFPALDAYVLGAVPDNRGSAYAVYGGLALLVEAMGSVTVGVLAETYPFTTIFRGFAVGLFGLVVGLVALYLIDVVPSAANT
jgi:MFS family permease